MPTNTQAGALCQKPAERNDNHDAARNAVYSGKNLAQSGHQALKAIRLRMPELMDSLWTQCSHPY
jgi:hypothetical protein